MYDAGMIWYILAKIFTYIIDEVKQLFDFNLIIDMALTTTKLQKKNKRILPIACLLHKHKEWN